MKGKAEKICAFRPGFDLNAFRPSLKSGPMRIHLVLLLLSALVLPGCRKKPESAPAAATPAATEPGTGVAAAQKDPDLTALNAAYKKFWKEQGSPPAKLEDLVAKNYMTSIPKPPPGKKFNVDWAKMEVSLVNQ